jgi:hypothetical protein
VEIWKDVVGYEGLYEVSNYGEIRSLYHFNGHKYQQRIKPYILSKSKTSTGYWKVELVKNGEKKSHKVHQLVGKAYINNPENKKEINHINFDTLDNNVMNLEWSTRKENMEHSSSNYRMGQIKNKYDEEKIVNEYKLGTPLATVLKNNNITRVALYRVLKKYSIKSHKQTTYANTSKENIATLIKNGYSNIQISNILNCPSNLIARRRYQIRKEKTYEF